MKKDSQIEFLDQLFLETYDSIMPTQSCSETDLCVVHNFFYEKIKSIYSSYPYPEKILEFWKRESSIAAFYYRL